MAGRLTLDGTTDKITRISDNNLDYAINHFCFRCTSLPDGCNIDDTFVTGLLDGNSLCGEMQVKIPFSLH